jgi:hypothetical protein
LVSATAFIHYDIHFNKKKRKNKSKILANIPMLFIPVILIIAFSLGPDPIYRGISLEEDESEELVDRKKWIYRNETYYFAGRMDEAESISYDLSSGDSYIDQIDLRFSWTDEKDIRRLRKFENQGDTFSVSIIINEKIVTQDSFTNEHDKHGYINLKYEGNEFSDNLSSNIDVKIKLEECKDYYPIFGFNIFSIEDASNTYTLEVEVNYLEYS